MKKHEFLARLEKELAHLPDVEEIIAYYEELINDAINSGQVEDEFIKHLGTPGEIKHKLSHDETFKENIKTKKNFSAAQTVTLLIKVLSGAIYIFFAVMLFVFALGLLGTGLFATIASVYQLATSNLGTNALLYYVFTIIFALSLIVFGVLIFIYLFKFSKRQAEKLQLFLVDKLHKKEVAA